MTLEDFKDAYKDKTPLEKLELMQKQHFIWRQDTVDRVDANWKGNYEEARYYSVECDAMRDRVVWLNDEISKALEKQEPVKPRREDAWPAPIFSCGKCGACLQTTPYYKAKYCFDCGQAVKWND